MYGDSYVIIIVKNILVCSILSCFDPDQSIDNYSGVLSEFVSDISKINLYLYLNVRIWTPPQMQALRFDGEWVRLHTYIRPQIKHRCFDAGP